MRRGFEVCQAVAKASKLRSMNSAQLLCPETVLFDMDGTLTRPMLDFPAIKAEMGIGSRPILEAMAEMSSAHRERAERILYRHEAHAAAESELNDNCTEVIGWLRDRKVPTALITRNSGESVSIVLERHKLSFDFVIAREHGPFKPNPWSILHICRRMSVAPANTWMVGDGQYDVEAGNAAGAQTVWLSHGRIRAFSAEPKHVVTDLSELLQLLQRIAN